MAGDAPKSGPDQVQQLEASVKRIDADIAATEANRSVIGAANNVAKLIQLKAQREKAVAELEKAKEEARKAAEAQRLVLAKEKEESLRKAAAPTQPGAPAAAPTPTPAPAPATTPETPAVAPTEAEKPDQELGFLERILKNGKVVGWLEKKGWSGAAELLANIASFFGIDIDRTQIQNEVLAEGSNAAISDQELAKLKELAATPKLAEFKDAGDPKAETAPWTHVAGWLGLSGKITNQADFFSVVSKGKTKVDLGADKGGQQEIPNFTSFKEAPAGGYKAGDVIIYQNKSGDRIPVVVTDASDPTSPVLSFVNTTGVLPVDKPFEAKNLAYQIKGTFNDPLVKKALADYTMQSTFRAASLADQQAWYLAKNPPKPKPAAPAGAPATVPGATPGTPPSAPAPEVAPGGPAAAAVPVTAPAGAPVTPPPSVAPAAAAAPAAVKPATAPTPVVAPAPAKPASATVPPITPPAIGTK